LELYLRGQTRPTYRSRKDDDSDGPDFESNRVQGVEFGGKDFESKRVQGVEFGGKDFESKRVQGVEFGGKY
jgi:hypothetical protein